MKEPRWLGKQVILAIQNALLARFGGPEGIRDTSLLESTLGRPQQLFAYGKPTLHELAASYAYGIAKNHPFLDGNKRAAFMSAYTFLGINGLELDATEESAVIQTLGLAAGMISEAEYATWLAANTVDAK